MSDQRIIALGLLVSLLLLGLFVYLGIRSDSRECEETGEHRVCKNWIVVDVAKVTTMQCTQWEVEPCK